MAARGEREVRVRFTGESQVLKGATGEVRKVFLQLQGDLNDTRSAGEKLAAAQKQVADSMRKDMEEIGRAADVVRDSLGPEMTAAIESTGRTVEDQVQEWRKLGLTLDDIKMESDKLAAGMKDLDDAARQSTGAVGDGMKRIGTETENSRSVMANFAGNAAQELPLVSNAFGPLNMAISQFVEYAAEGNIKMKSLVGMAAGIGIIASAMEAVADRSARVAEIKAFREDAIEGYTEALKDADNRVEAIIEHLRTVGKLQVQVGDKSGDFWTGGMSQTIDMTAAFASLGLGVEEIATMLAGGREKIEEWGAAAKASGADAIVVNQAMAGLTEQLDFLEVATKNNAIYQQVFGEHLAKMPDRLRAAVNPADELADAFGEVRDAMDETSQAYEDFTDTLDDDTTYQELQLGFDALQKELDGYKQAVKDGTMTQEEASRRSAIAINRQKKATAEYAEEVLGLPPEAVTEIFANIDNQKLVEAKTLVDQLTSGTHTIKFATSLGNKLGDALASVGKGGSFSAKSATAGEAFTGGRGENSDRSSAAPVVVQPVVQVMLDGRMLQEIVGTSSTVNVTRETALAMKRQIDIIERGG